MNKNLTLVVAIAGFFLAGAGGAWVYLAVLRQPPAEAAHDDADAHGETVEIPPDAALCARHSIPQVVCPFCDPELIERLGHCGGHDVPEALCTRCNPILIAAFKAEGDWCSEHGLPESQCAICLGAVP